MLLLTNALQWLYCLSYAMLLITFDWFPIEFIQVWLELYERCWLYYTRGLRDWSKEESFWTHQRGNKRGFWFLYYKQGFARCLCKTGLAKQLPGLRVGFLPLRPSLFDHSIHVLGELNGVQGFETLLTTFANFWRNNQDPSGWYIRVSLFREKCSFSDESKLCSFQM